MHLRHPCLMHGYSLVGDEGKQSHVAGSLDGRVDCTLVNGAGTGDSSGKNLAALADELSQLCAVLVVNIGNLVCAENADLLSSAVCVRGTGRTNDCFGCFRIHI